MSVICHIDQTEHESIEALHRYIRPKMKQESYYAQYLNKRDPVTGAAIPFKNAEQYLAQDFTDKNSLKKWIRLNPEAGKIWAIDWLRKRKEEKALMYAPSQVELRSLQCPSMPYFDSVGGYYEITRALGFEDRYISFAGKNTAGAVNTTDICIICDTREQKGLDFTAKTVKGTLNVGDYALAAPHDVGIRIERKSLSDFASTVNERKNTRANKIKDDTVFTNLERFDRELARAAESDLYVVMVVESSITNALSFGHQPWTQYGKVSANHLFKNMRDLLVKYPLTFQAVFADGREEAARLTLKILTMGVQVKSIDCQYALERGLL